MFVIAEPGDAAERFLESVKLSLSQGCSIKDVVSLAKIVTVADLVAWQPCFQAGGVLHRYIGRQTHVYLVLVFVDFFFLAFISMP